MEAYRERARVAIRAREGDADAAFAEDEIHPDDKPDEVEDPVESGRQSLELGVGVKWLDMVVDGGRADVDGILQVTDDDDIVFSPMDTHLAAVEFRRKEFMTMGMEMGHASDQDTITLTFKVDGEYTEMLLAIFDQSIFVNVAYCLLDICPSRG